MTFGGNDREMTTSAPGRHWEARTAPTTTAKLQQLQANRRKMMTSAETRNDRKNATTVKWQVRSSTLIA